MVQCGKATPGIAGSRRHGSAGRIGMQHAYGVNGAIPPETLAPPSLLGFNLNKVT
jgi:hypothetical protein